MSTILQAPEGIVAYSWSGNIPAGAPWAGWGNVVQVGQNAYIDVGDGFQNIYAATEKMVLSDTSIETLDLVSEGVIEGPLSGQWVFSGNLGQIGWSTGTFTKFTTPDGYSNSSWLHSVYWNQLPVLNDGGTFNFQNIDLVYTNGLPNGDILQELTNEETTSRTIGVTLYANNETTSASQIFRINNPNCKGVIVNIKIPELSSTDPTYGYVYRTSVQYSIAYRPIFSTISKASSFSTPTTELVFGKLTTTSYIKSTRIDFNLTSFLDVNRNPVQESNGFLNDPNFIGWEIKIIRLSPDSTDTLLVNPTIIDSITELYGSQLTYPNSAIIRQTFDSQFFAQIPERAFECNFIKVKIPANYDPIMRTYATNGYGTTNGYWNGTFASGVAWTNNPAWCFYDLITNPRYGLGKFVDNIDINKFDLYNIAQYCDQLVPDGFGGLEPRFTCNVWIPQKEDAYKVINDMASIFRGLVYYFNGNLNATQDAPKTTRYTFTNANVENGDFNYNSTSKRTRQSVGVIRYNDPTNFYQPAIEYVEDLDSIRRYGIRELPLIAFGCTSRGQAIRLGRWALYSNNIETETITFTAGLEANLLRCGDVFEVYDENRKQKRYGGRLYDINNINMGAILTLDSNIDLQAGIQYTLSVLTPTYYYDPSQVTGLTSNDYSNIYRPFLQKINFSGDNTVQSGNYTIVTLPTGLDSINYNVTGNPVWSIELGPNSQGYTGNFYFSNQNNDLYRVLNIKESDTNKYEIIGLSYSSAKFNQIDSGLIFSQSQTTSASIPISSPYNLSLNVYDTPYIQYSFQISDYTNISSYYVYITTGNFINNSVPNISLLNTVLPLSVINSNYYPASGVTGLYNFRVYSYNSTSDTFSTGCASGNTNVTFNPSNQDVLIGGLEYT